MSNIAGKAYAMNVITPIKGLYIYLNKIIFWAANWLPKSVFAGLETLSLIHYARWVIVGKNQFPHVHPDQPKESLKYSYMLFFSNFNGSWEQYVDSFHKAIPSGLNLLWKKNVKYPGSVPLQPFHSYINFNQMLTNHYYNPFPDAASNDVKAAKRVSKNLKELQLKVGAMDDDEFAKAYEEMLFVIQGDISRMDDTPVVSLAAQAVEEHRGRHSLHGADNVSNISSASNS